MSWTIERRGRAAVVTMNTNKVNADQLLDRAVAIAELTPEDCLETYAFTKKGAKAPW